MKITQPKELGVLVRTRRQQLGLSQSDVAERAGTTRQWLSRFEQGHSDVSLGNAFAILKVLELELGEYIDPATIAAPQPDTARTTVQPSASSVHSEDLTPSAAVSQGDRLRRLRERDALSGLKGWGTKTKPAQSTAALTARAPRSSEEPETGAHGDEHGALPEDSSGNGAADQLTQSPQGGPKYSIDADIARIAKSSLFKRS
ncbi:helix-turn-helix domain-containing protein [Populibacterium corticicola]|uniref:Helix-turn-helix domain-containing protein n=1 Tax=Populibacterium corticicola TaxID=1812826 RepID=A0ABW5XE48_9MICO